MGQSPVAQCCQAQLLPRPSRTVAAAPVIGPCPGIQPKEEFDERYEEPVALNLKSAVKNIRNKHTGLLYMCRSIPKGEGLITEEGPLRRYVDFLCKLEHPHLCKVVEAFENEDSYNFVIEMGFSPNLIDYLTRLAITKQNEKKNKYQNLCSEPAAGECLRQIISALAFAQSRGLVHGRLRPESFMLAALDGGGRKYKGDDHKDGKDHKRRDVKHGPPQIKIRDIGFGYALLRPKTVDGKIDQASLAEEWATPSNFPVADDPRITRPEHAINGPLLRSVARLDIWAVGVLAYQLFTGMAPSQALKGKRELVAKGGVFDKLSRPCIDMIRKMLRPAANRPTASELMKHPFIKYNRGHYSGHAAHHMFRNACINLQQNHVHKLLTRLAVKLLPQSHPHLKRAHDLFAFMDLNRDSVVDQNEFMSAFNKFVGLRDSITMRWDVEALFEAADRGGSGALDVMEFASFTIGHDDLEEEMLLWQMFRVFDRDEDGEVTIEDVVEIAQMLEGTLCAQKQCKELEDILRAELESLHITPSAAEVANRRRFSLPKYRRLDFGEFVYLCAPRPPDADWYINGKRLARKHGGRILEAVADYDVYEDARGVKRGQASLPWPPKEGSSASVAFSAHRMNGGLRAAEFKQK